MGVFSDMRANAPSRRVGALVIVVSAIITVVLIARAEDKPTTPVVFLSTETLRPESEELDTDGDGLKDWEEDLWGLSKNNPDTDGDGIGDSDEAENERRLVAEVPDTILNIYGDTDTGEKPSSAALAGQILISQLFAAKQAGIPVPKNSIKLASEVALDGATTDYSYPVYTQSNVNSANTSGAVALRAYGNAVAQALANPNNDAPHELSVLLAYAQTSNTKEFEENMDIVISNYEKSISRLSAVPVPNDRVVFHVALVNALARVHTDLSYTRDVGTEPISALAGLEAYEKNSTTMAQLFQQLRNDITQANIVFVSSEPGYLFMNAAQ